MPRPEYIRRLHEADYDLRSCAPWHVAEMRRRYEAALTEATGLSGLRAGSLERIVAPDFSIWRRQQGLPKASRRP